MYQFTFHRAGEKVSMPADSLRDATLLLPKHWQHPSGVSFSVTIAPITSDADYYKARCQLLESQIIQLLRGGNHA